MGCVGDLAADVSFNVRMRAAHVLGSTAEHARLLGDAELVLKAEGIRREVSLTALQHDASSSISACTEEVRSSHDALSMHGMDYCTSWTSLAWHA